MRAENDVIANLCIMVFIYSPSFCRADVPAKRSREGGWGSELLKGLQQSGSNPKCKANQEGEEIPFLIL